MACPLPVGSDLQFPWPYREVSQQQQGMAPAPARPPVFPLPFLSLSPSHVPWSTNDTHLVVRTHRTSWTDWPLTVLLITKTKFNCVNWPGNLKAYLARRLGWGHCQHLPLNDIGRCYIGTTNNYKPYLSSHGHEAHPWDCTSFVEPRH